MKTVLFSIFLALCASLSAQAQKTTFKGYNVSEVLNSNGKVTHHFTESEIYVTCPKCNEMQCVTLCQVSTKDSITTYKCKNRDADVIQTARAGKIPGYRFDDKVVYNLGDLTMIIPGKQPMVMPKATKP